MKIVKADESYVIEIQKIIREAYLPLLLKYRDEKENPANKTVADILYDLRRKNSDAYLLTLNEDPIGYVRVGQRAEGEYSIADLAILPFHQGKGYAQYFLKEIEKMYDTAKKWSLVTIKEEAKDCYLYEKLGYVERNILKEVNENMHFVLFVK